MPTRVQIVKSAFCAKNFAVNANLLFSLFDGKKARKRFSRNVIWLYWSTTLPVPFAFRFLIMGDLFHCVTCTVYILVNSLAAFNSCS